MKNLSLIVLLFVSLCAPAFSQIQVINFIDNDFIEVHITYADKVEMSCVTSTKRQTWSKNHDGFSCFFEYPEPLLRPRYRPIDLIEE